MLPPVFRVAFEALDTCWAAVCLPKFARDLALAEGVEALIITRHSMPLINCTNIGVG